MDRGCIRRDRRPLPDRFRVHRLDASRGRHRRPDGCLTPGALLDRLAAEITRSERHGHRLSCCFVDLDGFKVVNDRHGHLAGNRVLAAAADALRSATRHYDVLGRFGGDEFVVLLPQTDLGGAAQLAERMGAEIAAGSVELRGLRISASIGVAEWAQGMAPREVIGAADEAQRVAKSAGGGVSITGSNGGAAARTNGRLERLTRALLSSSNNNKNNNNDRDRDREPRR